MTHLLILLFFYSNLQEFLCRIQNHNSSMLFWCNVTRPVLCTGSPKSASSLDYKHPSSELYGTNYAALTHSILVLNDMN